MVLSIIRVAQVVWKRVCDGVAGVLCQGLVCGMMLAAGGAGEGGDSECEQFRLRERQRGTHSGIRTSASGLDSFFFFFRAAPAAYGGSQARGCVAGYSCPPTP